MEFKKQVNAQFLAHWQSLPRSDLLPSSSDFRPEAVPGLLADFAIYELISADFIKVRLSGTHMDHRHGMTCTGRNYLDLVDPQRRESASKAFWTVATHPCGMRVFARLQRSSGTSLEVETLGLPMLCREGENPLLYLTVCDLDPDEWLEREDGDRTEQIAVGERTYFDIGAGVPE